MIQLIYSEDQGQLDFEIKKIKNSKILFYKGDLLDIYDDFSQFNFLENNSSNYVIKNSVFFSNDKSFKESIDVFKLIYSFRTEFNIAFIMDGKKITTFDFHKLFPDLKIVELKKLNKWNVKNYISDVVSFLNLNLNIEAINYLSQNFVLDSYLIFNELSKLKNFQIKNWTIGHFNEILNFGEIQNVFEVLSFYFDKDIESLVKYLNSLEDDSSKYMELFNIMVSQIFTLKLFVSSYQKTPNFISISKTLNVPTYQIEKWKKYILSFSVNNLENMLNNLLELELRIMRSQQNIVDSLKLFLIGGY